LYQNRVQCNRRKNRNYKMKLNRFVALAAIALLVVAAMGTFTLRSHAQNSSPADKAVRAQNDPYAGQDQDDDTLEAENNDPDADNVDLQCGNQNEADDGVETADAEEGGSEQDDAPLGTPAITADAAQQTAEAYLNAGSANQVELDDENGQLVYSVEIGSSDVKVDAMTGAVLGVETGED
jgi:uncharacterized membrane protein YkoI